MGFEVADELSVEINDEPGALAAVLKAVANSGVGIRAFSGYSMAGAGNVMFVAMDSGKARQALEAAGYTKITASQVVVGTTQDRRGAAADIAEVARKSGINLEYSYATGTGKGDGVIVLAAGDDTDKLADALKSLKGASKAKAAKPKAKAKAKPKKKASKR